jgi:hypothetical protein
MHELEFPLIKILDSNLTLAAVLDCYSECYFTRSLREPGDFGFCIAFEEGMHKTIKEGNFILIGGNGERIGIIEQTEYRTTRNGTKLVIVRGHEAKSILSRRIILPPEGMSRMEMTAPAETVMKQLVASQCGPLAAPTRQFPFLIIESDRQHGEDYQLASAYANLLSELCGIAEASRMGFSLSFDIQTRSLTFDIIEGTDRSSGQNAESRALFAQEYDSLIDATLEQGIGSAACLLYVLGSKSGDGRTLEAVWYGKEPEGFERIERACDAPSCADRESLVAFGRARLVSHEPVFFLEAEIPPHSPLILDTDYRLGDLCSVHAYGQWHTVPIHSIEERWTLEGSGIHIGFGKPASGALRTTMKVTQDLLDALRAG